MDKSKFYQELIPSLKVNGKPEALGLCPFHDDTNPSFSVNVETGLFRCFSCDAKGDIFTFYQRVKNVDFPKRASPIIVIMDTLLFNVDKYDNICSLIHIKVPKEMIA